MSQKESATILIVDDDPCTLNVVAEQISIVGYESLAASTAREALQLAEKYAKIDLLLTDIIMPEMNGFDLARQFDILYPETRIIFMSGNNSPFIAGQKIPVSDYGFVQKPFEMQTLIDTIQNILVRPVLQPEDVPDT